MAREILQIAKRLVPDLAKLLATAYGGPVAGAFAHRITEGAVERIEAAARRIFRAPESADSTLAEAIANAEMQGDPRLEEFRGEIEGVAQSLREDYAAEFARVSLERESVSSEELVQTERERARLQNQVAARENAILAWAPPILSLIILAGFFVSLGWLIARGDISTGTKDVMYVMLGALTTSVSAVVTYWFGSNAEASRRFAAERETRSATAMQVAARRQAVAEGPT